MSIFVFCGHLNIKLRGIRYELDVDSFAKLPKLTSCDKTECNEYVNMW